MALSARAGVRRVGFAARGLPAALALLVGLSAFANRLPSQTAPPPRELIRQVAAHGSLFEKELGHYTYRQTFQFFELDKNGLPRGHYQETRDVLFTPEGERTEEFVKGPVNALQVHAPDR